MLNPSHPVYLEVNLSQLKRNVEAIRAHVGSAKVMPMVKANAYGHGVDGVAPFIEPYVDYFGVSSPGKGSVCGRSESPSRSSWAAGLSSNRFPYLQNMT
jgi:hypothetical protein